jgi:hypothetical protein
VGSCLGLRSERAVFERYRRLRRAERAAVWAELESAGPWASQSTAA